MKKNTSLFFYFIFLFSTSLNAQLTLSFSTTLNHGCNGNPCNYSGPSILINEVMLTPSIGDGSMYDLDNTRRGEWIELYNPDQCKSIDISCYYLGNNAHDPDNYGGGYRIPDNTIVPPMGFVVIRGEYAPAVPSNLLIQNGGKTIELIADNQANNICIENGGNRLWFPNAGGWFAFYNRDGVPQDAISWNSLTNSCMSCPPCIASATSCNDAAFLAAYDAISVNNKSYITPLDPLSFKGQSWRRIPDGANWNENPASPTMGDCNTICNPPPVISCDGTATVNVSGGTPPYTFSWNTPQTNTTSTATALCQDTYCVSVKDAMNMQETACVNILNYSPPLTFAPVPVIYLNDEVKFLDLVPFVTPKGGYFHGQGVISPYFYASNIGIGTYTITYDYADDKSCKNSITQNIYVLPGSELLIPNFLTPNGDHANDEFIITYYGIVNFRCIIYNRWGKQIYEWNDISKGWDGKTANGTLAAEGVYYYILYAKGYDTIQYEKHGSVTLFR
jgi:gliding motility-associated-like protein